MTTYGRKAWAIVGYTFQVKTLCPACLHADVFGQVPANEYQVSTEDALSILADVEGIDRIDEYSFDSNDFPKVILDSMLVEDERCDCCNESL